MSIYFGIVSVLFVRSQKSVLTDSPLYINYHGDSKLSSLKTTHESSLVTAHEISNRRNTVREMHGRSPLHDLNFIQFGNLLVNPFPIRNVIVKNQWV